MTDVLVDEARRNEIVWLLEHRNDHLPLPTHRLGTSSGFVGGRDAKGRALRTLSCPDCLANDRVMFGCETCGGSGEVPDDSPDPYATNVVLPFGHDPTRHDMATERDGQIARLERQTRPPRSEAELLQEANQRGYAWEEARAAMYRTHDFALIDQAFDWLGRYDADASHAINAVYVDGWLAEVGQITPLTEQLCERGLHYMSALLPEALRTGLGPKHPALIRRDRKREREAA